MNRERLMRTPASGEQRVSRLRLRDLLSEASAGILQRPLRSALTMLGTVLGVAAFVAILGLTATARGQIDKAFTVLSATQVTVTAAPQADPITRHGDSFPDDADARIRRLNGVRHAGLQWRVRTGSATVSPTPSVQAQQTTRGITMTAADPGALAAVGATVATGRLYGAFVQHHAEPVAVLGPAAAKALNVHSLTGQPAVFVGDRAFTVIGVLSDVRRHPELLSSVIIPTSTAITDFGRPVSPPASLLIDTRLGAAPVIAHQAALALRPNDPKAFTVSNPTEPTLVKGAVSHQLDSLLLLLAGVSLVIGAFGIANTTLVAITERTSEIGLRRALGARRRHIATQFLTESATLGTLGGLIGTSIGVTIVIAVALAKHWSAILAPWAVLPAPLLGGLIGLAAGAYPALRAAWIQPIDALQH